MCLEEIMKVSSKMPSYSIDHGRLSLTLSFLNPIYFNNKNLKLLKLQLAEIK